jgi:predicted small integral membrane protein
VNFGSCPLSYVFASQFSCAAKTGEIEPAIKMLRIEKARTEPLFTNNMTIGAVINLSWSMKIVKKITKQNFVIDFL